MIPRRKVIFLGKASKIYVRTYMYIYMNICIYVGNLYMVAFVREAYGIFRGARSDRGASITHTNLLK